MPFKDPQKLWEYQKNWLAEKRSGANIFKCFYCPQKMPMAKKFALCFTPICGVCLEQAKKKKNATK